MIRALLVLAALLGALSTASLAEPRTAGIKDPETRAWWEITEQL